MTIDINESNDSVLIKLIEKLETTPKMNVVSSETFLGYIAYLILCFFKGELTWNSAPEPRQIPGNHIEICRLTDDGTSDFDEDDEDTKVYNRFLVYFEFQCDINLQGSEETRIESLKELCDLYRKMFDLYQENDTRDKYIALMVDSDQYFDNVVGLFNGSIIYKWNKCIAIIKVTPTNYF